MDLNEILLQDLAARAQLHISPEEEADYLSELNRILSGLTLPEEPDAEDSAPVSHHALRSDVPEASMSRASLLEHARDTDGTAFLVPIAVTQGGDL